ncbi:MAG: quinate 5-dehydrogenase [Dehalococcoidia bacterium]|nr:MAG: quinate 5-dehydrogenase [Dehalococcoidia bacterium]
MKRAVSISLGSSTRDKAVEVELLGERVSIERIGTDGDMERAVRMYRELDGKVDAFGVGGTDLGVLVDKTYYPLHSVHRLVRDVKTTPYVDGGGLKNTLERGVVPFMESQFEIDPKRVLFTSSADRWGMAMSFYGNGYECVFGDLMFALGLPVPLHTPRQLRWTARVIMPIAGRLPFSWVYPTGEKQEQRQPKYERHYRWATVLAGDCHYVKRHAPDRLDGKIICTNTTTEADVAHFRASGVRWLVTTTPVLDGRSFGTNMMEAALVAVAGKGRALTHDEIAAMIRELGLTPTVQRLSL